MTDAKSSWSFVGISAEARQAAEEAAEMAGMELDTWLAQLIKYTSAMELAGRGTTLDEVIRQARRAEPAAEEDERAPEETFPGIDPMASPERSFAVEDINASGQVPVGADDHEEESADIPAAEIEIPTDPTRPVMLSPEHLHPSALTSLATAREEDIEAALDQWRKTGKLDPLIVRRRANFPNEFEVVTGIERWHAARRAHAREVPALVQDLSDTDALKTGLAARLKGKQPTALVEATTYLQLMTEASQSTEQVAALVGKPAGHVAAMVRILNLPQSVRGMLERGEITILHARALLDAHNPEAIARQVVAKRLDIYQTEQLVRGSRQGVDLVGTAEVLDETDLDSDDAFSAVDHEEEPAVSAEGPGEAAEPEEEVASAAVSSGGRRSATTIPFPERGREREEGRRPSGEDGATTQLLERHLSQLLGLKVTISERDNIGVVALHYLNRDQLSELIARLNRSLDT